MNTGLIIKPDIQREQDFDCEWARTGIGEHTLSFVHALSISDIKSAKWEDDGRSSNDNV